MPVSKLKNVELAYFAGLFDGEGSLGIMKHNCQNLRVGYRYELAVQVSSMDEYILRELEKAFAGRVSKAKCGFHPTLTWRWCINSRQAVNFLKSIKPYLRLKKYQAGICIKFGESKKVGRGISDEQLAIEKSQRKILHSMTRKGRRLNESDF